MSSLVNIGKYLEVLMMFAKKDIGKHNPFHTEAYDQLAELLRTALRTVGINFYRTKYKFKYGNCVLVSLAQVTGKSPEYFKKTYGMKATGSTDEELLYVITKEFGGDIKLIDNSSYTYLDWIRGVKGKKDDVYLAVTDIHMSVFSKNKVVDDLVISRPTIIYEVPLYVIKLNAGFSEEQKRHNLESAEMIRVIEHITN